MKPWPITSVRLRNMLEIHGCSSRNGTESSTSGSLWRWTYPLGRRSRFPLHGRKDKVNSRGLAKPTYRTESGGCTVSDLAYLACCGSLVFDLLDTQLFSTAFPQSHLKERVRLGSNMTFVIASVKLYAPLWDRYPGGLDAIS